MYERDEWIFKSQLDPEECIRRLSASMIRNHERLSTMREQGFLGHLGARTFTLSWKDSGFPNANFVPFRGEILESPEGSMIRGRFAYLPRYAMVIIPLTLILTVNFVTMPSEESSLPSVLALAPILLMLVALWRARDWGKRGFIELLELTCLAQCLEQPQYSTRHSWGTKPPLLVRLSKLMAGIPVPPRRN
jgi:hypothetical protein